MIAFEERPGLLLDPGCNLDEITFLGQSIGMPATRLPGDRIVEVSFSPLVKVVMLEPGSPPNYLGFNQRPLRPENVRASVVHGSGVLHTNADISFTIDTAKIKKVSIYGQWMKAFAALNTMRKLREALGAPDVCLRLEAEGDTIAYDSYYSPSRKWVRWMTDVAQPTVVVFGDGADALQAGERGGVKRTLLKDGVA